MESHPVKISPFIKSPHALALFEHFIAELQTICPITFHTHKTMISIMQADKRIAYVTYAGKNFIDIVLPFKQHYEDNFCFRRIQAVPGRHVIYHHFRMLQKEDINDEVRKFIRIACQG